MNDTPESVIPPDAGEGRESEEKRLSDAYRSQQWHTLRWYERRALKLFATTIGRVVSSERYDTIGGKDIGGVVVLLVVPFLCIAIPVWLIATVAGPDGWFGFLVTIPLGSLVFARVNPWWRFRKVVLHRIRRRVIGRVGLPPFPDD